MQLAIWALIIASVVLCIAAMCTPENSRAQKFCCATLFLVIVAALWLGFTYSA